MPSPSVPWGFLEYFKADDSYAPEAAPDSKYVWGLPQDPQNRAFPSGPWQDNQRVGCSRSSPWRLP